MLIGLALQATLAAYFPLEAGWEWRYNVNYGRNLIPVEQVQKILPPSEVEGKPAIPMEVWLNGEKDSTVFYAIDKGYLLVLAVKPDTLLPVPIPVLPSDPKRGMSWQFEGQTSQLGAMAPEIIKSRIVGTERVDVLGEKKDALKVIRESESAIGPGTIFKLRSTEYYVANIGLVKRVQEVLVKNGGITQFTLAKYKAPGQ
jgi:hypothetical protein